jgi:hypothetical protein
MISSSFFFMTTPTTSLLTFNSPSATMCNKHPMCKRIPLSLSSSFLACLTILFYLLISLFILANLCFVLQRRWLEGRMPAQGSLGMSGGGKIFGTRKGRRHKFIREHSMEERTPAQSSLRTSDEGKRWHKVLRERLMVVRWS